MSLNFKIISIEGNIGSGKSTLLENLKTHYKDNANIIFLREPVDDWAQIKDANGNNMLQIFYADQEKYSFAFQMMAYISRLAILRDAVRINQNQKIIIITERSLYTDKYVFAKMLYDQGKIEDVNFQIYNKWFNEFANDYPINDVIYVNTKPTNCYNRVHKRARPGEEIIPLSYLSDCHNYHETFLKGIDGMECNKLELDGNVDIYENPIIIQEWVKQIDSFIQ
jgi:deoxyadenosine/deoxycytidine kinase